jgi:hypothetical protein
MESIDQGRSASSVNWAEPARVLEALSVYIPTKVILQVLERTGRSSRRIRRVPADAVFWLIIAIGLWGDLNITSLWRQVIGTLQSLWLAMSRETVACKSALSQARSKLGARPLRQVFCVTAGPIASDQTRGATYKNMPMKAMDGQDYTIPDTPENLRAFGKPITQRKGATVCGGYPQIHTDRLIEVGTRITLEAFIKPHHFNDHPTAPALLARCNAGDLIFWDCGFYSYKLIKQAIDQGTLMLGPGPSQALFNPLRTLADGSFLCKIFPNTTARKQDRDGITVRILQYTFDDPDRPGCGEVHRLVTTLRDEQKFPAKELIVLYHQRWEIEIANDEIVTHQLARAVNLRSKTPVGIVQEFYGVIIAHNAIRMLMHEAARSIDVDPRTLSFVHAVRVIREAIPLMRAAPTPQLPYLYRALIQQIAQGQLPPRDGRINPRVVKIKMSNYLKKRPEHCRPKQPKKSLTAAIVMLK